MLYLLHGTSRMESKQITLEIYILRIIRCSIDIFSNPFTAFQQYSRQNGTETRVGLQALYLVFETRLPRIGDPYERGWSRRISKARHGLSGQHGPFARWKRWFISLPRYRWQSSTYQYDAFNECNEVFPSITFWGNERCVNVRTLNYSFRFDSTRSIFQNRFFLERYHIKIRSNTYAL